MVTLIVWHLIFYTFLYVKDLDVTYVKKKLNGSVY